MPFTDPFVANPFPFAIACTLANPSPATYDVTSSLVSGVYTISWSGDGTLNIDFYNGTTLVTSTSGTSPITVNLAQSVTYMKLWTSIAPISIIISLSGLSVAPVSGILYTYTTSQVIPLVGDGYFVLVGAAGGSSQGSGSTGAIVTGRIALTGTQNFVVGVAGTPGNGNGTIPATAGGPSTFAGFTALGGNPGTSGLGGAAVAPNGVAGAFYVVGLTTSTAAAISGFSFFNMGSTGSGGSGPGESYAGGGSGIGTGGTSATSSTLNGGNATGYGASGGGGGSLSSNYGGLSTGGVLYIVL